MFGLWFTSDSFAHLFVSAATELVNFCHTYTAQLKTEKKHCSLANKGVLLSLKCTSLFIKYLASEHE